MLCNICNTITNKKVICVKVVRDDATTSSCGILEIVQEKSEPIPDGYQLVWDGTISGFDFVVEQCGCNATTRR